MPRYRSGYKRSSVTSSTGAISENAVVFQSSGGHTHDGSNSSLIETNSYSVWDFQVNTVYSTTPRADRQNRHIEQFRNFISNHVNNNVLEPAGVVLGENVINATNIISNSITTDVIAANAITANEIAANAITANEIAANAITANEIAANAITANEIAANAITANEIAAATITTSELATDAITSLNYSYTSGDYSNSGTFFNLSDGSIISAQFSIDSSGNASFAGDISGASGTFTGDLSGGSIDIGGSDSTSFHVDSSGNMWVGNASYSSAPFKVDSSGNLIVGNESLGRGIRMDTSGNFWAGSNTFGSASTFKINGSDGTVTMAQSLLSAYNTSYYWGQLSRRNVSTTGQSSFNEWGLRLKVPSSSVYRNSGYTISIAPDNGASDTSYSKNLWIARSNVEDDEDYTLGNNRYYDPAIRLRYDANLSGGVITMYGAVDISGDLSPHTMTLIQNPVGTTYGSGVNDTPTYMITQMAGNNDYWRIYGESTASNNGRMVLEVTDDQTELIILRHKKTYSPWSATEHIFSPSGLSTPSVTATSRSYFKNTDDVDLSGVSGSIIIGGDGSGSHIAIDNNEIMAKANGTTTATLNLNINGGDVVVGGRLKGQESSGYGADWSTQQIQSINTGSANAGIAIRAGNDAGTVQLRVGHNNPTLYIRDHDDSNDVAVQMGQIISAYTYNNVTPGSSRRDVFVATTGQFGYLTSSIKTKKNIKPIHYGLSDVMRIKPVSFEYINNPDHSRDIGMIEEELREVVPEVCVYDESDPDFISSINYSQLAPLLIKAIQDLKNEVDELKSQLF